MGDDAIYALGKARAQFGHGQSAAGRSPRSTICARAGPTTSRRKAICSTPARSKTAAAPSDALYEYQAVANYYPGAEARVRYGLLLGKAGRRAEAKTVFPEVLTQLKRAPKYVRRAQANGSRSPKGTTPVWACSTAIDAGT